MFEFSLVGFVVLVVALLAAGGFIGVLVYRNNEKKMDERFDKIDDKYDEHLKDFVEKAKKEVQDALKKVKK